MKPVKIFIFYFIILIALFLMVLLFPEKGIQITDRLILTLPKIDELKPVEKNNYKNIKPFIINELNDRNPSSYFSHLIKYNQAFNNIIIDTLKYVPVRKVNIKKKKKKLMKKKMYRMKNVI